MKTMVAFLYSRTSGKRVSGCCCCVVQKLCECSCLENVCPDVAVDFDIDKNGVSPAGVTSSATSKHS